MMRDLTVIAMLSSSAAAQPVASTEPPSSEPAASKPAPVPASTLPPPLTAADVASAPYPGDEDGRTDQRESDSATRRTARALLFVPRLAADAALSPLYATVWAEDRYHLDDLYYRIFYNADRTIGLYPTGTYSTGYGASAGARFIDSNLVGHHEELAVQATTGDIFGEAYHESADASINSGRWLGRLQFGAETSFDRRPNDPFYGIGNANVVAVAPPTAVDPLTSDVAISTRYRYQEMRASSYADVRVLGPLHVRTTAAVTDHAFGLSTTGPATDAVYTTSGLVGWPDFTNLYGELELRIDTRRQATLWEPHALHAEGWLLAADFGRVHELDEIGPDFWRGIVEAQHFWRIAQGPRLLAFRLRGEAVSGSVADVPFSELPMLGGGDFLRGYDFERFRDRVAALGSVEYVWDLAHWFDAALFVDVGRVYSSLSDLTLDQMRVGYGVALEIYTDSTFLCETSVASSIDGGLFFNLSFNPVFDARPRWR